MRIAFLHKPNDPYAQIRMKYFVSKGHQIYSIVFHSNTEQKPLSGVEIISLPFNPLIRIPFLKRIVYAKSISNITSRYNIDVLYVISALNSYYLKASKAKRNYLEIQGSDVIRSPRRFPFLKPFYRTFWKYADGIFQDSQLAKEKAKPYLPDNILNETIEIGVDFNVFNNEVEKGRIRTKYNLENRPIVFHSRGLKKIYNPDTIIKSIPLVVKHFPDVCFMFAGNIESLSSESKKFIETQNLLENILFCGWIDHDTEMKYYNRDANLMVSVPSSDSSPFSVYEAMATKTPVIASDLPWFKGKFVPGVHFLTVPVKNDNVLAKTIVNLLKKEVTVDLDQAYSVVFNKINMHTENERLEKIFENAS